jgi:Flp pilus assembly protein TadD
MHPTKTAQKTPTARATLNRIALAFALICTQISPNSALAQTAEISEQAVQQANAFIKQGKAAYESGDFQQAIQNLTQAIAINPRYAAAYNNRGISYYDLKNYSSAIRDYTQAIAINPNDALAYYNRGLSYSRLDDDSSAVHDYTQAIAINPNLASAYNNRALSLFLKDDYRSAILDARKACSLGNCEALEFLGKNGWLRD